VLQRITALLSSAPLRETLLVLLDGHREARSAAKTSVIPRMRPIRKRFSPLTHRQQHWLKAVAEDGERVLHAGWNLGIDLAVDDSVVLQLAEDLRQRARRDPSEKSMQLVESLHPIEQV